jgi:hypothetical protein
MLCVINTKLMLSANLGAAFIAKWFKRMAALMSISKRVLTEMSASPALCKHTAAVSVLESY